MDSFPRPTEERLYEKKEKVNRVCPECGSHDVAAYRVLSDAGWWDVVKCTCLLINMDHFQEMNEVYAGYFKQDPPARAAFQVVKLPLDVLIEIEAIAMKD